ncbi:argininosuccinate synthase [Candidatus Bipolaricaulota bacterium]|nr:argininosuccinate synthase [Candidatus Bipolaricaulota bacterium]
MHNPKKVLLAYSGGLDTSVIVPWLKETYGCEVIAFTGDVGQGAEELEGLEAKALNSGASKLIVADLREEFLTDYAFPTLRAGAIYEGLYLLGTSTARPIIAKAMIEAAHAEGADALAHGCTGKGNDQVRFELTFKAIDPTLPVIAPWRLPEWTLTSREDALAYAEERGIPVANTKKSIYSRDRNIWHISHEGGDLEDPWNEPLESMFCLTVAPEAAPDTQEYVIVDFEGGTPVGLEGQSMGAVELMETLNALAGKHGVGREDIVENRLVGMKSHGVYETPGGTVLYKALAGLESLCLDCASAHYKALVSEKYAEIVYNGQWFSPLREALDAFVTKLLEPVTGSVRVKLFKGTCSVVGRESSMSLYQEDLATFGKDDVYNQSDATGFINLFGLPMTVTGMRNHKSIANVPSGFKG